MDKIIEFLGKILEKLTSAKLLWTLIIAIAIFGLTFVLASDSLMESLGLNCLRDGDAGCPAGRTIIGAGALAAISLILASFILWIVTRVRERYFV
jgi:hypothetical protein